MIPRPSSCWSKSSRTRDSIRWWRGTAARASGGSASASNLILCDVDMPHLSGFGVLQQLRKSVGQLRNIPFLFITAYGSRESHLQARRLSCDDFLTKPLDFELLVEIVRSRLAQNPRAAPVQFSLTDREIEALTWVARGESSTDIAVLMK